LASLFLQDNQLTNQTFLEQNIGSLNVFEIEEEYDENWKYSVKLSIDSAVYVTKF